MSYLMLTFLWEFRRNPSLVINAVYIYISTYLRFWTTIAGRKHINYNIRKVSLRKSDDFSNLSVDDLHAARRKACPEAPGTASANACPSNCFHCLAALKLRFKWIREEEKRMTWYVCYVLEYSVSIHNQIGSQLMGKFGVVLPWIAFDNIAWQFSFWSFSLLLVEQPR